MPFEGANFTRRQNFTRDRNAGPPDDFIQAEKVDDDLNDIASGLTAVRGLADAAPATVRGGVDGAYDTLKKLYDWAADKLSGAKLLATLLTVDGPNSKLDADTVDGIEAAALLRSDVRSTTAKGLTVASDTTDALFVKSPGNTFIGLYRDTPARKGYIQSQNAGDGNTNLAISNEIRNLTIAANGQMYWDGNAFSIGGGAAVSPYLHMSYPNVRSWYFQVDGDAHMRLVDNSAGAQTHKFLTNGDIISKYCSDNRPGGEGSLMSWIEYRAATFADNRVGQLRQRISTVGEVDSFVIARLSGGPRPSVGGAYAGSQLLDADSSAGLGLGGAWRCLSQAAAGAPYTGLFYRYA